MVLQFMEFLLCQIDKVIRQLSGSHLVVVMDMELSVSHQAVVRQSLEICRAGSHEAVVR